VHLVGSDKSRCRLGATQTAFYASLWLIAGFKGGKLHPVQVISIVDDDESVREATKSLVRSLGYKSLTFSSAEEFLESPYLNGTACLITDVQMPGLSGVELQDRLIAAGHRIPVIFVTGFPDDRLHAHVLRSGAIGYLRKPYKEDDLVACIYGALEGATKAEASALKPFPPQESE
jgi:FixJ family two-component response regulator